ncbi:membrane protein [Clostridium novyi B str. ATCC 27606]|uniref:Membrane protein n=2 Tax=Clostridium TaxID=1485 RepID=A0AA40ISY9_CLONO|nr:MULTISPECIES: LrgB family protein [Clostridium]KEI12726.1 membrane protein [Clostridium novyi B str. ATCC 27606]KEI14759.1 membrane protein [Clostridium novyi B str. NCTC 9691]KEI16435.1 membrane protein [Clostridium haemolyticum NCTC 9693]KGN04762.1 membrane protein [Clostridium haemolyticum NCTC 8350]CAG7839230.1 Inner membrane protein YohK [Clostridium haemolyticum]
MNDIISSPIFGVLVSLIAFEIGCILYSKTKLTILNPLLISIIFIMLFLIKFHISLDSYNEGAQIISFFLGPSTVILAVPLYKKLYLLKQYIVPILVGICSGSCVGIISVILLCKAFKLDNQITLSMLPKSVTTPIGIEISKQLGGLSAVTVGAILLTGILGAVIGPFILNIVRVKNKVAIGIAIGTASHAVGTSKAVELGETEGAMSGLCIGIAGLLTVFLAPVLYNIVNMLLK